MVINNAKSNKKTKKSNFSEFLNSTKLSRRAPLVIMLGAAFPKSEDVCGVCEVKLEGKSGFPSEVKVCRKCSMQYAATESILIAHADDKTQQAQSRGQGGRAR